MKRAWRRFLAYWRLDLQAVCEESKGRGYWDDYHDYPDDCEVAYPMHLYLYTCSRCGKQFYI